MAFFPVLSIRYKEKPTQQVAPEASKPNEKLTPITDLSKPIVWSTRGFFDSVVNFLSGRSYNPDELPYEIISTELKAEGTLAKIIRLARSAASFVMGIFNSITDFFKKKKDSGNAETDPKLLQFELKETAKYIVEKHKELLTNRTFPPASRRGQYPSTRTGFLAKSIVFKKKSNEMAYDIGYKSMSGPTGDPAEYSQVLVDWGRKSIPDTTRALSPIYSKNNYLIEVRYDGSSF
jgi:hypothetical protein